MNKSKIGKIIISIIILAIICAGITMAVLKGFNYGRLYTHSQRMNIYFENEFNIEDIKNIASEVFGKPVEVQLGNRFETVASIINNEISDENKNSIIEKINEKYEIKLDEDKDIVMVNIPQANLFDMVSIYIMPLIFITIISMIYFGIRFRKNGILKSVIMPFLILIANLGLFISAYSLIRIPVNELFTVVGNFVYIITLLFIMFVLKREKKMQ